MKRHLISHDLWTVLAVYADEERCDVLDLATGLRRDDPGEYARLMRAFERLSASGPPRNVRRRLRGRLQRGPAQAQAAGSGARARRPADRGGPVTELTFKQMFAEARGMPEYWEEGAILDFTEALYGAMEEEGVTRAELARRLGTSQAYITRVLGGHANFTLKTMAKLALALGLQLEVGLGPQRLPSAAGKAEEEDAR